MLAKAYDVIPPPLPRNPMSRASINTLGAGNAPTVRKAEASFIEKLQEQDLLAWNRWGLKEAAKQLKEIEAKKNKRRERKLDKGIVVWSKAKLSGVS
jgi:hypothetical protein